MKFSIQKSAVFLAAIVGVMATAPVQVCAEEPAPGGAPAPASTSTGKVEFKLPKASHFTFTQAGGGIGGTEEGFSLQGHAQLEDGQGNSLRLTGTVGAPLLQVRGRAELIPVELKRVPIAIGNNGDLEFQLEVIPVSADAQLQLSSMGQGSNSHLILDPKLAASMDWLSPESLKLGARLRTTVGPAGGVVHDGDGTSGIFGIQVGVEGELSYLLTPDDQIDFLCGVDVLTAAHKGIDGASTRSRCELGYTQVLGQDGAVRLALVHDGAKFDVAGPESGRSGFTGLMTTFTLPTSKSVKGN
jgi:hypothetical protein